MPKKHTSRIKAIATGRCPRCRQGKMFTYPLAKVSKFTVMNETCPCCQLKYEVEPGFFIGAMYISYAITVALLITFGVLLFSLGEPKLWVYVSLVVGTLIIFLPVIFRYSRILFLHLFGGISFDDSYKC